MVNPFVFPYLDDILIFSKTLPEQILQVRQVLRCHLQSQLYIKIEKCEVDVCQVSLLGHIISTVTNCPVPPHLNKYIGSLVLAIF